MSEQLKKGLSCPVLVPEQPDWFVDYSGVTAEQLVSLSDEQLATVDPLVVNLLAAKGIPGLVDLQLCRYQEQVNEWAQDFASRYLPFWETVYERVPEFYEHNHHVFRVGMISQYLNEEIGIRYRTEKRDALSVRFLNPADLFLNGLLDTLEGTCASMPALHVAIGWRMGWSVSLACSWSHLFVRHDDDDNVFNVEATCAEEPGFVWATDEQLIKKFNIRHQGLSSGSDLKALTPRERLGEFIAFRARHYCDLFFQYNDRKYLHLAEHEYLLARYLFPASRWNSRRLELLAALTATEKFDPREAGHPETLVQTLAEIRELAAGTHPCQEPMPPPRRPGDSVFSNRPQMPRFISRDNVCTGLGTNY